MTARRADPRAAAWFLGLLTVAALALRLWGLGASALLPDEGSSFYFSQLPLATLLYALCDPHPPGYPLLLAAVTAFGRHETILRLPSALAGTLAVPLTWAVGRAAMRPTAQSGQRWPHQAALLAAALVAFAPLAVWYSREARPYALLSLLTLAMVWAGLRWRQQPGALMAGAFLLAGWLALGIEYGALAVVVGLNLLVLSGWPGRGAAGGRAASDRRWLALQTLLLAPFALWWLFSAQRMALAQMSYQAVFLAVQAQGLGLDWTPELARRVILLAGAAAVALGVALAVGVRQSARVRELLGSRWVAIALAAAVLALAVLGALPRLYTVKRHLNALLPFVSIAAAWALLRVPSDRPGPGPARRALAVAMPAALAALSLAMLFSAPRPAWPQVVATLAAQAKAGDAVWVDELDAPVFAYYWERQMEDGRGPTAWQPLRAHDLDAIGRAGAGQRVWLAGSVTPYRDLSQTLPADFAARRAPVQRFIWRDAALTAYDLSAAPQPAADPPLALQWGLTIQSPLDVVCSGQ